MNHDFPPPKTPRKFVGRSVDVETGGEPPAPVTVRDGDREWTVAEVERVWFDTGHGGTPSRARTWRTRRHRKDYVVRAVDGARLHIYLDYARDDRPVWQLVTVEEPAQ